MFKRIKQLMEKTDNFYLAVMLFAEFYSIVYTASQFGYFTVQSLQELENEWKDFCEFINSYGIIEPLCVERFDVSGKFDVCCFGEERCLSLEEVLQKLLQ